MAGYAMQHAEVVAQNITAQLRGEQPTAVYRPLARPHDPAPARTAWRRRPAAHARRPVRRPGRDGLGYKGADLFTGRFTEQFGAA